PARVVVALLQGANETAIDLFLARQAGSIPLELVERRLGAYVEAFERILGLPPGSLVFVDEGTIRLWFDLNEGNGPACSRRRSALGGRSSARSGSVCRSPSAGASWSACWDSSWAPG